MKNQLLILLMLTIPTSGYCQFFIGDTKDKVKTTLTKNNVKFTEDKLTDSTSRISWLIENEFQSIWVLDNHGKVIKQTLISEKKNGLNDFIKWFNKDFVIISDTEWKNYSHGVIYHIRLIHIYTEPLFTITLTLIPELDLKD